MFFSIVLSNNSNISFIKTNIVIAFSSLECDIDKVWDTLCVFINNNY